MSLSIAIMAHPARLEDVERLLAQMDPDARKFGVRLEVCFEHGDGLWDTAKRTWRAYDPEATHHLVLQDDLALCQDFIPGVLRALEFIPDNVPVGLFNRWGYIKKAHKRGHAWARSPNVTQGQALMLPTNLIEHFITWCDENLKPVARSYDMRFDLWMMNNGHLIWNTVPCLVQHIGGTRSVFVRDSGRKTNGARIAKMFIGEDKSALFDVDFSKGADNPGIYTGLEDEIYESMWPEREE